MGWLADLLQELPVSAALKIKLEQFEAKHEKLQAEYDRVKEENEWLKAELQRFKGHDDLDPAEENILKALSDIDDADAGTIFRRFGLSVGKGNFHMDRLRDLKFVRVIAGGDDGLIFSCTKEGRAYLARKGRL
jgi:hypothetical protein